MKKLALFILLLALSGCSPAVPCDKIYKDSVEEIQHGNETAGYGMLMLWNHHCPPRGE